MVLVSAKDVVISMQLAIEANRKSGEKYKFKEAETLTIWPLYIFLYLPVTHAS